MNLSMALTKETFSCPYLAALCDNQPSKASLWLVLCYLQSVICGLTTVN